LHPVSRAKGSRLFRCCAAPVKPSPQRCSESRIPNSPRIEALHDLLSEEAALSAAEPGEETLIAASLPVAATAPLGSR
jgi:hypothetical protein